MTASGGEGSRRQRPEKTGVTFIVTATALRPFAPARLDDERDIAMRTAEAGRATMALQQQAWRHNGDRPATLPCDGALRIDCVAADSLRPTRLPSPISETLSR